MTDRSLAQHQRAITTANGAGQLYLYPHPLTLARDHAEAERFRLADSVAYSSMCATWGRLGGLSTYYRYGSAYFRLLAMRRWEKITAEDLAAARSSEECFDCHRRFLGRDLYEVGEDNLTFFEGDLLCRNCAGHHGVI